MQTIDQEVSIKKFEQELAKFRTAEEFNRKRGVLLLKAQFPNLYFGFVASRLQPAPIVFAVKINFDNYDLEPLSVRFIHPFTFDELLQPVNLFRKTIKPEGPPEIAPLSFVQENNLPMICLPGIREYHNHPAHTGDLWMLHRNKGGEGTLGFIVDKLYDYGISAISGFQIHTNMMSLVIDPNLVPL